MENEIKAIIEKNLPEQVGNLLKERLIQAERDKEALSELQKTVAGHKETIAELEKKKGEYKNFDDRNSKIETREAAVAEQEREQKVFKAELKAAEAEKRATELAGFVGMVFKSPVFRRNVYSNDVTAPHYENGNTVYKKTGESVNEEKTEE